VSLEADFQGSGQRGSNTFVDAFSQCIVAILPASCAAGPPANLAQLNGAAATSEEAKIEWFGTARLHLGYLVTDQLLVYGTGGLAYGRVGVSGNINLSATPAPFVSFTPGTTAFSESRTNVGWTAGAGIEGRFASWLPPNWTWKLEYLYIDLGSLDTSTSFALASNIGNFAPFTGTMATHTHFTDNIVRVGLNYQFH
jgi:outer membrane immunogenic protein